MNGYHCARVAKPRSMAIACSTTVAVQDKGRSSDDDMTCEEMVWEMARLAIAFFIIFVRLMLRMSKALVDIMWPKESTPTAQNRPIRPIAHVVVHAITGTAGPDNVNRVCRVSESPSFAAAQRAKTFDSTGRAGVETPKAVAAAALAPPPTVETPILAMPDAPVPAKADSPVPPKADSPVPPKAKSPVPPKADSPVPPKDDAPTPAAGTAYIPAASAEPIRPKRASDRNRAAYMDATRTFAKAAEANLANRTGRTTRRRDRPTAAADIVCDGLPFGSAVTWFYTGGRTSDDDEAFEFAVSDRQSRHLELIDADSVRAFCARFSISQGRLSVFRGAKLLLQGSTTGLIEAKQLIEATLKIL